MTSGLFAYMDREDTVSRVSEPLAQRQGGPDEPEDVLAGSRQHVLDARTLSCV